jgi:hypothetical protein
VAFQHGRDGRVLVEDVDMSTFFNSMDISLDVDAPESTTFGAAGDRTYVSAGLRGGTVALSGFYDAATDAVDEEISTVLGNTTNRVASLYPQGHTVGNPVYLPHSIYTSYSISQPTDGLVSITADIQPSGAITRGFSLHQLTAETATSSGTAVDLGSTGNPGGVGHLHVTSSSGTAPTLTVTVDHATSSGGALVGPFPRT